MHCSKETEHNRNYRYVPHNDVSVNDGPHIRVGRWSHTITILYYNILWAR